MSDLSSIIAETLRKIAEGGKALNGRRIPQANVQPTIDAFVAGPLKHIPHRSVKPIGSTGKKKESGDLDLGLDTDWTIDQVAAKLQQLGLRIRVNKGLGEVSVLFPIEGLPGDCQIDLMFGPEAWTKTQYYGPSDIESKYKGVYVRGLVNALAQVVAGYSVSPAKGVFRKNDPQKQYIQDWTPVLQALTAKSKEPWGPGDLEQPFEKIWEKVQRDFDPQTIAKIKEYFLSFMKSTKQSIPAELGEAVGGTNTYGKVQTVGAGGQVGQGNIGGPRNRGRPGYPVPDVLKPEGDTEALEEAVDPSELEGGIKHLDDLKPEEFLKFLKKFADTAIPGLEISEKVDGSARMSFGVASGHVWTQSKNGSRKMMASQYQDTPVFAALKHAHQALESRSKEIVAAWPEGVTFMVAEVLYTKVPNTIEYGPNVLMIHGVHSAQGVMGDAESKAAALQVIKAAGGQLADGNEEWKFDYKRTIDPKDFQVDVRKEYDSLGELYQSLAAKPRDKDLRAQFQVIQKQVKEKLLGQLHKQRSMYGPEGGDVEGIVFRDLESGAMTKLVDKDYFTKLNQFMWNWRKRLDKDVMEGFRKVVATQVFGDSGLASTALMRRLLSAADPKDAKLSPEMRADMTIARYIKKNNLMSGNFMIDFHRSLMGAFGDLEKIKSEYSSRGEERFDYDNPQYGVKKSRTPGPEVASRNEEAFRSVEAALQGILAGANQADKIDDPLTKKTAIFKLFLGHRYQRLVDQLSGGLSEGGPIDRMTGPTDLSGERRVDADVPLPNTDPLGEVVSEQFMRLLEIVGGPGTIGATIGRYQPFHAGHAAVIRELAKKFSKVLVFVAGQKVGKDNPFSYETRLDMMEKSLADVWSKVRIFPAVINGKGTGYVPGLIANAANNGEIEAGHGVDVLIGEDRLATVRQQIEHNKTHQGEPGYYTGEISVQALPGVKNDDDTDRISGTRVREAILKGDKVTVRRMLDPRLSTDQGEFEKLFVKLTQELGANAPVKSKATKFESAVQELVLREFGMGAHETTPGGAHTGGYGSSAWSRGVIAGEDDGDEMYQQMIRSPSTRMLPLNNPGQPNVDQVGVDSEDSEGDPGKGEPTDLGEVVTATIVRLVEDSFQLEPYTADDVLKHKTPGQLAAIKRAKEKNRTAADAKLAQYRDAIDNPKHPDHQKARKWYMGARKTYGWPDLPPVPKPTIHTMIDVENKWMKWSEEVAKNVPFEASEKNVGNGEMRVVAELGGGDYARKAGKDREHDIDVINVKPGNYLQVEPGAYEVKEIYHGAVFAGAKSNEAAFNIKDELVEIGKQIKNFIGEITPETREYMVKTGKMSFEPIDHFVKHTYPLLAFGGHVSMKNIESLKSAIIAINAYRKGLDHDSEKQAALFKLSPEERNKASMFKNLDALVRAYHHGDIETLPLTFSAEQLARRHLRSKYFDDPDLLDPKRALDVPASTFFKVGGVKGVFITQKDRFALIPVEDVDKYIRVTEVSKHMLKIGLKRALGSFPEDVDDETDAGMEVA